MFNALTGLGWGLVVFAITIGIGAVVLIKFGDSVGTCDGGDTNYTYNLTLHQCYNQTDATSADPSNAEWTNLDYLGGQLGTSGLAGWTPAIIAFMVGMMFLGGFLIRKGSKRQY